MRLEKEMAALAEAANKYGNLNDPDLPEETQEDNSRLEKIVADYVKVLRPRILISAKDEVFHHEALAGLSFHRATSKPTIPSLCDDVLRTRATTLLLVDPPDSLDLGDVQRRTRCFTLILKSGGAE